MNLESKVFPTIISFFKSQYFKFLIIGGINTLFGYIVLTFFLWLQLPHSLAFLIGTLIGIIFNFFTTGRLVFKSSNNKLFFRFILGYLFLYVLNLSLFKGFLFLIPNQYLASFFSTALVSIPAYFVNKKFIFAR